MNKRQLAVIQKGVATWNAWRIENPRERQNLSGAKLRGVILPKANLCGADLSGADLSGAKLSCADLSRANLEIADLSGADLFEANLEGASLHSADLERTSFSFARLSDGNLEGSGLSMADLSGANLAGAMLRHADLSWANLEEADLTGEATLTGADANCANLRAANLTGAWLENVNFSGANLSAANLSGANLTRANLSGANLSRANLSRANLAGAALVASDLRNANLNECYIYGLSAWDLQLDGAIQTNLRITPANVPEITVDNLEVAQFIYLLLKNEKIRQVIDSITSKVVLILGRFTPERKEVLEAIREGLRKYNRLPILFDFDKPASRDTHETITTLARLARFIIADITDPRSIPQELVSIVEQLPSVPVQPILLKGRERWGMFDHLIPYPWVLPLHQYESVEGLLSCLSDVLIMPAESRKRNETR